MNGTRAHHVARIDGTLTAGRRQAPAEAAERR
jgi:hypothetical protein